MCTAIQTELVYVGKSHLHPLHNLVIGKLISSKVYARVLLLASVLLAVLVLQVSRRQLVEAVTLVRRRVMP